MLDTQPLIRQRLQIIQRLRRQITQIKWQTLDPQPPRIRAGQQQQILNQPRQPPHLPQQLIDLLTRLRLQMPRITHRLQTRPQHRHRRFQLMRGIRRKTRRRIIGRPHAVKRIIQHHREPGDLIIRRRHRQPFREILHRNALRSRRKRRHRPHGPISQPQTTSKNHHTDERQRHQQPQAQIPLQRLNVRQTHAHMHREVADFEAPAAAALPRHAQRAKARLSLDALALQIRRVIQNLPLRPHQHQKMIPQIHRHKLDAQRMPRIHRRTAKVSQITHQLVRIVTQLPVQLMQLAVIKDRQQSHSARQQRQHRQQRRVNTYFDLERPASHGVTIIW